MNRKVTFIELAVLPGVVPLASGYMEAVCRKDPALAASSNFEKISLTALEAPTHLFEANYSHDRPFLV